MKKDAKTVLKDNTMIIVLVLVYVFFMITTKGAIFLPMNLPADEFQCTDHSERICIHPGMRHADVHPDRRQH